MKDTEKEIIGDGCVFFKERILEEEEMTFEGENF